MHMSSFVAFINLCSPLGGSLGHHKGPPFQNMILIILDSFGFFLIYPFTF